MSSISGTQDQVYLEHIEYVRYPGPRVVGRVRQEADDLKVPDKAHAQEQSEYRQKKYFRLSSMAGDQHFFLRIRIQLFFSVRIQIRIKRLFNAEPDPAKQIILKRVFCR